MSERLNCQELAAQLNKHPTYITAMLRAGYRFEDVDSKTSTLDHALEWLCTPEQYASSKWFKPTRNKYSEFDESEKNKHRRFIPASLRRFVYERDGSKCHYCGAEDDLTVDHKLPVSKGGTGDPENLLTACFSCNLAKGNTLYEEFLPLASNRKQIGGGRGGKPRRTNTPEQDAALLVRLYGLNYDNILAAIKEGSSK